MLKCMTAGESHGKCLIATVSGLPAGLKIDEEFINSKLKERQGGFGRGGRMKIETDKVEILTGIRKGFTIGSPLVMKIHNKDYKIDTLPDVFLPRPGHADLSGILKYGLEDARSVLERASARETAARVACGAICQTMLADFGIEFYSHVTETGPVKITKKADFPSDNEILKESELRCIDKEAEKEMISFLKEAVTEKDTAGGIVEVVIKGVPVGIGSYISWETKLDAMLAGSLMSIQAIKGVEVGLGFDCARTKGSNVHDEIFYNEDADINCTKGGYFRKTNNAGGIEGGISNGEDIIVKAAMKPIPTLMQPLKSIDINTKEETKASTERSDVCAISACSIVCETASAVEIAKAFLEKFGSDSMDETKRNYNSYIEAIQKR